MEQLSPPEHEEELTAEQLDDLLKSGRIDRGEYIERAAKAMRQARAAAAEERAEDETRAA